MRFKESTEQNSYLKEADSAGALELIYASLDVLGKTPWKINKSVFDVALKVWNEGWEYPRIPPLELKQQLPPPLDESADMQAKSVYLRAVKMLSTQRNNHHSERCSSNYKMEIARTVRCFPCFIGDAHSCSSLGRNFTFLIILISVVEPILSHRI